MATSKAIRITPQSTSCPSIPADGPLVLIDAFILRKVKNFYSKKYGIGVARFSHKGNIIHSSTKFDDAIRYQSPHDNVYLAYFTGHSGRYASPPSQYNQCRAYESSQCEVYTCQPT